MKAKKILLDGGNLRKEIINICYVMDKIQIPETRMQDRILNYHQPL